MLNFRGVSERFKVQSWKGCVGAIPPWVRIPSPLNFEPDEGFFKWDADENPHKGFERPVSRVRSAFAQQNT